MDDKVGVFAVAETVRLLKGKTLQAAVYGVSTVQEEIGLRGAQHVLLRHRRDRRHRH